MRTINYSKELIKKSLKEIKENLKINSQETQIVGNSFQLFPDEENITFLKRTFGAYRQVINWTILTQKEAYEKTGRKLKLLELNKKFKEWKQLPENKYLYDFDSACLQQAYRQGNESVDKFIKILKHREFVNKQIQKQAKEKNLTVEEFLEEKEIIHTVNTLKLPKKQKPMKQWEDYLKTKKDRYQSFTTMTTNDNISFKVIKTKNNKSICELTLPKTDFKYKFIMHRKLTGIKYSKIVISCNEHNKWKIVFFVEQKINALILKSLSKININGNDLGCINYLKTSNETQMRIQKIEKFVQKRWKKVNYICKHINDIQSKIDLLINKYHLSEDIDKSLKFIPTKHKDLCNLIIHKSKLNQRALNLKNDTIWILTKFLSKSFTINSIETLNSNKLKQDSKGTAKNIQKFPFFRFKQSLAWESLKNGSLLYLADPYFASSKTCSNCGHKLDKDQLKITDREWTCPVCGKKHDRDENAAFNLSMNAIEYYLECIKNNKPIDQITYRNDKQEEWNKSHPEFVKFHNSLKELSKRKTVDKTTV